MARALDAALDRPDAHDRVRAPGLRRVTITGLEALQGLRAELEALCGDLGEENVFYEPWMVGAALTHLGGKRALTFVCLYEQAEPGRLCGFFPLMRAPVHSLLPLQVYQSWHHPHCFRCTPLIRRSFAQSCWKALFDWLEQQPAWRRLLHLRHLPADGEVERALRGVLAQRPALRHAVLENETAFLRIAQDSGADGGEDGDGTKASETVLRQAMSGSTLGKLRRQQRRLAEHGELVFAEAGETAGFEQMLDQFLQLEASGWKGKVSTALACNANEEAFFRAVIDQARERGQLSFLTMSLGGRLLAAQCALLGRGGSFLFKTAYDESYAKFSPGILLEIEHLRRMHAAGNGLGGRLAWADSCAEQGDGPVYRCWPGRRAVRDYSIACGGGLPRLVVALWPLLRRAYHVLQQRRKGAQAPSRDPSRPPVKA